MWRLSLLLLLATCCAGLCAPSGQGGRKGQSEQAAGGGGGARAVSLRGLFDYFCIVISPAAARCMQLAHDDMFVTFAFEGCCSIVRDKCGEGASCHFNLLCIGSGIKPCKSSSLAAARAAEQESELELESKSEFELGSKSALEEDLVDV